MKQILFVLLTTWSVMTFAGSIQYTMHIDGLACPFCAYGIEKKLKAIDGIQTIDVDLDKGLVIVIANDDVNLTNEQMTTLFQDTGFTFRSMQQLKLQKNDK